MAFWAFLGDFVVGMSFGSIWVMYLGGDVIGSYNLFFFCGGVLVVWIFLNFGFCFLLIVF